jgi:hypothetical protein
MDRDRLNRQDFEAGFNSWDWQTQAEALLEIHRDKLWRTWIKNDSGATYSSFVDYVSSALHMNHQTAYNRVKLAEFSRFRALKDIAISPGLAESLLKTELLEWIFSTLVLLAGNGVADIKIQEILKAPPEEQAERTKRLAQARIQEGKLFAQRVNKLLKQAGCD